MAFDTMLSTVIFVLTVICGLALWRLVAEEN
jgi:hypothetical protein